MKIGMIGVGGMGSTHNEAVKALSEEFGLEVTAIAECRPEFMEKAAALWPNAKQYTYGADLIEQETLDCVHICLPSYLHAEHAVAAMKKGMDVLVEKPVCLTEEDTEKLLTAQKETGRKVMVGQVVRFFSEYRFLKEAYESGRFGKLKSLKLHRLSGDVRWGFEDWFHDEAKSGSVILDLHVHDLDFLRYLLGEPQSFQVKATEYESGMVNHVTTDYEYPGIEVSAEGLWDVSAAHPFQAGYMAYFEKASIEYDNKKKPSVMVYPAEGEAYPAELQADYVVENQNSGINISSMGAYYTEIRYFYECLTKGLVPETAELAEGVKSVKLGIAEWKAAKNYCLSRGRH